MFHRSFICQGYAASIRVEVPGHIDRDDLQGHVAPEISIEAAAGGPPPDLSLTQHQGLYRFTLGKRRYGPFQTVVGALQAVSNGIHFVIGKRSPLTFLHAGAIELDGAAVIFPGRSRWGKSTLVSSLVDQGCGYLSDEYAIVSQAGAVFPLSKPIRLRRTGGAADLRVPPAVSAPGGLPCRAMILTRFERGAVWDPESLTPGCAVFAALPYALQSRESPGQVLDALMAAVKGAARYRGTRGDGELTADTLRELRGWKPIIKEACA